MTELLNEIKVTRVMASQAGGTTDLNTTHVDMGDGKYDGVLFIALLGALTATQVTKIKAQQGQLANDTDMADLAGSAVGPLADGDSNKALALDIFRPQERYVRCVVDRGTAAAVVDGVVAIQYRGLKGPSTQDASIVASKVLASPDEGTA